MKFDYGNGIISYGFIENWNDGIGIKHNTGILSAVWTIISKFLHYTVAYFPNESGTVVAIATVDKFRNTRGKIFNQWYNSLYSAPLAVIKLIITVSSTM